MTHDAQPGQLAQLTNMVLAMKTMVDLRDAGEGSPRIGLFHGYSGYGKSVAAAFCGSHFDAAYIEAKSVWTRRSLLEAIAAEVGVVRIARTAPKILGQVVDTLLETPRPLIIDEMDHLVKMQSVEIIRDIHDSTSVPILLIGEEALPHKLMEWERFHTRVLITTAAQPANFDDARKLRDLYCGRVHVDDDLVELFADRCAGVTRRIVVNLKGAQRLAIEEGATSIDRKWWGDRPIANGAVPVRRKIG